MAASHAYYYAAGRDHAWIRCDFIILHLVTTDLYNMCMSCIGTRGVIRLPDILKYRVCGYTIMFTLQCMLLQFQRSFRRAAGTRLNENHITMDVCRYKNFDW